MTSTSVTVQIPSLSDCPEQGPELVSLLKQFMAVHTLNMRNGNRTIPLVFLMVLQVVVPLMVFLFSFFTGLWKKFLSHKEDAGGLLQLNQLSEPSDQYRRCHRICMQCQASKELYLGPYRKSAIKSVHRHH